MESRFREIHTRAHSDHPRCIGDEWAMESCRDRDGNPVTPLVWSRRNGAWQRVSVLWVGAAPGNAGGMGKGALGAHGTRIPFGGDVAGANLEVLLGSIGLDRNRTFIIASYNRLPARGGGEPSAAEIRAPVGDYPSSVHLLRDTVVATGPRLIVALGNVALRTLGGALCGDHAELPTLSRMQKAGLTRGRAVPTHAVGTPSPTFLEAWSAAWDTDPMPSVLWLTHPSAQNMSPFAGRQTAFHRRMREARAALRRAAREVLGITPSRRRAEPDETGIYALPEWRDLIAPRFARLDRLWRAHGL